MQYSASSTRGAATLLAPNVCIVTVYNCRSILKTNITAHQPGISKMFQKL